MQRTDDSGDMSPSEEKARLKKEAIAWVIRLQNASLSQEDRRAFEAWYAQSPQHVLMYRKVSSVWESPELNATAAVVAGSRPSWLNAKAALSLRWSVVAVACVVLVGVLAYHFDVAIRWQADYRTGSGERRTVELPDRSIATLNTQSAMALSFDGNTRRVRLLKGEALFNVQRDVGRPFIVESADAAVRAIGTAFIVRTEPGRDQVTVIEGSVEVGARQESHPQAAVSSGSQIRMERGQLGNPYAVNMSAASAWLRGRLVVNGAPFEQVLEELRRYHPGTIVLWNRQVAKIEVTGTYNVDDPATALALLAKTVPVSVVGMADRLVILF